MRIETILSPFVGIAIIGIVSILKMDKLQGNPCLQDKLLILTYVSIVVAAVGDLLHHLVKSKVVNNSHNIADT